MKKILILAAILAGVLIPLGAMSAEAPQDGEALVRQVWSAIKAVDVKTLETLMDPGFQSVHEDGARNQAGQLELIKGLNIEDYQLSEFKVTRAGDVMIVTYQVVTSETIDGKRLTKAPAMRMSVFVKIDGAWRWAAHANLRPLA